MSLVPAWPLIEQKSFEVGDQARTQGKECVLGILKWFSGDWQCFPGVAMTTLVQAVGPSV